MLLDQFGNKVTKKTPDYRRVAIQTFRERYSTYPSHGLTPETLTTLLKEADIGYIERQAELFQEIEEKDLHLQSVIQTRKLAVAGLEWEVHPATEDTKDTKIAEAAKEMLTYVIGLEEAFLDILDAIGKGFSVCELIWEYTEGKVWVKNLEWVHQKRFTFFDDKQNILYIPQLLTDLAPVYGEPLQPHKFVYHRHKSRSGFPSRGGLYRTVAWFYLFKNYDIKDWMTFNDLFAVPMRIGKYMPDSTKSEIETLKEAVFNLGNDSAAVISDSTKIELLESTLRGNINSFKDFADYCDKAITKAVLGHTGSSDSTPGRLGGEDEASDIRADLKRHDARALENTVRHQILAPWVFFNYGAEVAIPKFQFHTEDEEDTEKLARVYSILVKEMGFKGIPESHIYEKFGIPKPEGDEPTVQFQQSTPIPFSQFVGKDQEDAIAGYINRLEKEASLDDLWTPILKLINESKSLEELKEKISSVYSEVDTKSLADILQRALVTAELIGRFEVANRS